MMSLMLAWRSVLRNRRRSMMVGGAAALAGFVLTLAAGFVAGTAQDMRASIIDGGRGHFQIATAQGFDGYAENQLDFALTPPQMTLIYGWAARHKDVRAVVPRLSFGGLISSGPRTVSFSAVGIDPAAERRTFRSNLTVVSGAMLSAHSASDAALIGQGIASQLGLKVGSLATLLSTTASGAINAMDVTVDGIVSTGSPEADQSYVQTTIATAQGLLATHRISRVAVLARSARDAPALMASAVALAPGLAARDWQQLTPMFGQILAMYDGIFLFFGLTLCGVASFTIAGAVLTSVLERTSEIGLMKALSLRGSTIRGMFVGEGAVLGLLGSSAGVALGALAMVSLNGAHLMMPPPPGANRGYPLHLVWSTSQAVILVCVFVVLAIIAAWAVSGRASRLTVLQSFASE